MSLLYMLYFCVENIVLYSSFEVEKKCDAKTPIDKIVYTHSLISHRVQVTLTHPV